MSIFDLRGKSAGGKPTAAEDRRGHPRTPVILQAQIETSSGQRIDCTVLDISSRGARVAVAEPLAKRETVTLTSADFATTQARTMLIEPQSADLQFRSPHALAPPPPSVPSNLLVE